MEQKLLLEYRTFIPEGSNASLKTDNTLIVKGTLQRANALNQNGRVYPGDILKREAKKYMENFVKERRALGELDHPESSVVNLQNASHIITDMWWDGDDLKGTVEILDTPAGNILKKLFAAKITLGISSRGMGSVKEVYREGKEKAQEVQEDYSLLAFDFVSDPSTQNAFMYPDNINEAISRKYASPYNIRKINTIISGIFCDLQGKCSIIK